MEKAGIESELDFRFEGLMMIMMIVMIMMMARQRVGGEVFIGGERRKFGLLFLSLYLF